MKFDRPRWRWSVLSAAAVVALFLLLVRWEFGWHVVGLFHLRPFFTDLVAILAAGDAQRAGLDIYQANPFDPFGRPHVYGPWWLALGKLGCTTHDAWWLGSLLGLAFIGVTLWLHAPRTWRGALLTVALLISPPVLLGIERANNDLVVFLLLAAAAALLVRRATWAGIAAAATLVFAAVLKFYPLAALAGLLARRDRVSRLCLTVACSLAAFAALWWQQRDDFFRAFALAPRPDTFLAYGARLIFATWSRGPEVRLWLVLGYAVGGGLAFLCLWRGRSALGRLITGDDLVSFAAVLGGSCWLFCYFANNNYPYRAVLLLLVVPAFLRLARDAAPEVRACGRGLCALLLAVLWFAAPRWWAINWLRYAEPQSSSAPLHTLLPIIGAEQVLVIALSGALLYGLVVWAWRRTHELVARD